MCWKLRPGQIGVARISRFRKAVMSQGCGRPICTFINYRPCVNEPLSAARVAAVGRKASKVLRGV
jgi:hypothetical protein